MIVTQKKEFEEILSYLKDKKNIFIVGCGSCATTAQTGGEEEVKDMESSLTELGFNITGSFVVESPCDVRLNRLMIRDNKKEWDAADAVLVLSCGAGLQAIREISDKILVPGLDSLFLGTTQRLTKFSKYCSMCGECVLAYTGGFCPRTRCAKGMVNGPCGGAVEGKCEVDRTRDCVWVLIYNYLKEKGELDLLDNLKEPVHNSKESINTFEVAKR